MLTLHTLTLDHVAGVRHATLSLPDTGVVVVHGPNEVGKSTLLTAFRLLLADVGVGTKKAWVRALKSATEDEATTVSAELTVGEHRLTVLKSFNRGAGRCELTVTSPRPENLTGRQAADRFAEILSEDVDADLLDALTISQGDSLDILPAAGIRSLEQALGGEPDGADGSATTVAGGAGESTVSALLDRINAEYARYFTAGGRPTRELAAARKNRDEADEARASAQERYSQAQGLISRLEELTGEKAAIARQEPEAVAAVAAAEQELARGREAVGRLDRHRDAVSVAEGAFAIAEERSAARIAKIRALEDAEDSVAVLTEKVRDARSLADEEKLRSGELREQLDIARHRSRVAAGWVKYLTARQRREEKLRVVADLTRRCGDAQEVADGIATLRDRIDACPASGEALEKLHRAEASLHQAETVRDALATTVSVTGPVGDSVTVDGDARILDTEGVTVHVTGRRVLGVGGYSVTVTPARDVREVSADVVDATEELAAQLGTLGVGTVAEAEASAARRREDGEALRESALRLAQLTGDSTVAGLREALDAAEDEAEELAASMAAALDVLRVEDPEAEVEVSGVPADLLTGGPTDAVIVTATAAEVEEFGNEAAGEVERIRAELDRVTRSGATVRLETHRAELEWSTAAVERLTEDLSADREAAPDAELESAVEDRRQELAEQERLLTETVDAVGEIDIEFLDGLMQGAVARVRRLRERAVETGNAVSRMTGALGEHTGAADLVETTRVAWEQADHRCRAVEQRADAAALLHHEVGEALAAARRRYETPLREEIERLSRSLYGAPVHFEFGDDLSVGRRSLGGVTLDTMQLSGGAREQLAVLTRLAVAELVGRGESVPVIIDDALGFSDRGRIGRMNVVLDTLGRDHQIIVLTCDLDRFDGIVGATVVPMDRILDQTPGPSDRSV